MPASAGNTWRLRWASAAREGGPGTLLVDLGEAGVLEQVPAAKGSGATRVVGFLGHLQTDLLEAARSAGADEVLTRGQFVQRIDALLRDETPPPGTG